MKSRVEADSAEEAKAALPETGREPDEVVDAAPKGPQVMQDAAPEPEGEPDEAEAPTP
jgi:hypothetical protein